MEASRPNASAGRGLAVSSRVLGNQPLGTRRISTTGAKARVGLARSFVPEPRNRSPERLPAWTTAALNATHLTCPEVAKVIAAALRGREHQEFLDTSHPRLGSHF